MSRPLDQSTIPVWALIPASGTGQRMGSSIAKQYRLFQGKTVLEHCLDRVLSHPLIEAGVIVIDQHDESWESLGYHSNKPIFVADGGRERIHSVYNGLQAIAQFGEQDTLVVVHDAARPLVTHDDLEKVINAALAHEVGAILASPITDTLKRQGEGLRISETISRDGLWRALTPQAFHFQPLYRGLKAAIDSKVRITDDAAAVERLGYSPLLVPGDPTNMKITYPGDLAMAEHIWLNQRDQQDDK